MIGSPIPHDTIALLAEIPSKHLVRGQAGTVIETLDGKTVLVEYSGENGGAYAILPLEFSSLLLLHYVPEAA